MQVYFSCPSCLNAFRRARASSSFARSNQMFWGVVFFLPLFVRDMFLLSTNPPVCTRRSEYLYSLLFFKGRCSAHLALMLFSRNTRRHTRTVTHIHTWNTPSTAAHGVIAVWSRLGLEVTLKGTSALADVSGLHLPATVRVINTRQVCWSETHFSRHPSDVCTVTQIERKKN